jgi:hypothetical protein
LYRVQCIAGPAWPEPPACLISLWQRAARAGSSSMVVVAPVADVVSLEHERSPLPIPGCRPGSLNRRRAECGWTAGGWRAREAPSRCPAPARLARPCRRRAARTAAWRKQIGHDGQVDDQRQDLQRRDGLGQLVDLVRDEDHSRDEGQVLGPPAALPQPDRLGTLQDGLGGDRCPR